MSHIRILDLSRVFAGPWAAQMLADFGADVIKIEHVEGGDDVRRMGVPHKSKNGTPTGETSSFLAMNRGKRSIAIDLSQRAGQQLVLDLAEKADVIIENFKVGNLARFGLDYDAVAKVNPRLVYCSITGYGQTGPDRALAGYDPIFQAMSGVMSVTGVPDGQPGAGPSLVGYSISDINAGHYAVIAILVALHHRDHSSGSGQHIDIALLDAQIHAVSHMAMNYFSSGTVPVRRGAASQMTCPWQAFEAADKSIMIAVGNDAQFRRLADLLDLPALGDDPRFATNLARVTNRETLVPLLAERISLRTAEEWDAALKSIGVASGPINSIADSFDAPQVRHREMRRQMPHPSGEAIDIVANPIRFSGTPVVYERHPPLFAEHSDEVLADVLGLTGDRIAALRRDRAIR